MSRATVVVLGAMLAMLVTLVAGAGDAAPKKGRKPAAPAAARVAPVPVPREARKTADALAGRWRFEGTMTMPGSTEALRTKFEMGCRKVAGGRAAACEFKANFPGQPPMAEAQLWAYNPEDQKVHLFAVNTAGEVHDHVGTWKDDQTLEFEPLKTTDEGKPIEDSLVVTWEGPGSVRFDAVTSYADGTLSVFRGNGVRR